MAQRAERLWEQHRDILTVCLNPALDLTVILDELRPGRLNVFSGQSLALGGKGINVAAAIQLLGGKARLFSLDYADSAQLFHDLLQQAELEAELFAVPGSLRINAKLHDEEPLGIMRLTEVNGPGERVSEADARAAINLLISQLRPSGVVVLSGSLPPGIRPGLYRDLAKRVNEQGGISVLDSSGDPLLQAMAARCDILKPNRTELREVTGMPVGTKEEAGLAALSLCRLGARLVLASLGADGAVLTDGGRCVYAPVPSGVQTRSLQGAGDAMTAVLAVYAASLPRQKAIPELPLAGLRQLLHWAMAASQATVRLPGTRMPTADQVRACLPDIEVRELMLD